ncbi:hypothetical protein K439DRAFT_137681 [Ramaria rubella]|nr:hypothetical protein K439DRAFT_137681 [Ramaria rubella]
MSGEKNVGEGKRGKATRSLSRLSSARSERLRREEGKRGHNEDYIRKARQRRQGGLCARGAQSFRGARQRFKAEHSSILSLLFSFYYSFSYRTRQKS